MRTTVSLRDADTQELIDELSDRQLYTTDLFDRLKELVEAVQKDSDNDVDFSSETWQALQKAKAEVEYWCARDPRCQQGEGRPA